MKIHLLVVSVLVAALAAGVSCSKKSDDSSSGGGGIAASKATSAFTSADTLLSSSVSSGAAASIFSKGDVNSMAEASDSYCTQGGGPLAIGSETGSTNSDGDNALTESGQESLFNRRYWWCMMNHKSNGPDTIRGSIMKIKGFMCALDAATGGGVTFDGASHSVTIDISATCFTSRFATMAQNQLGKTSVTVTYTATTTPSSLFTGADDTKWTHAIKIDTGTDVGAVFNILLNMPTGGSQIAAMVQQHESKYDVYGFTMDFSGNNATIRYEGRFAGYSDGTTSSYNRHIRTIATGVYTGDGGFSSITSAHGVVGEAYRNSSSSTSYTFRTVNGDSTGIKTDRFTGNATNYAGIDTSTSTALSNACYSGCSIASFITSTPSADKTFLTMATASDSTTLFPGHAPLSFTDVDLTVDVP